MKEAPVWVLLRIITEDLIPARQNGFLKSETRKFLLGRDVSSWHRAQKWAYSALLLLFCFVFSWQKIVELKAHALLPLKTSRTLSFARTAYE